MEVLEQKGFPMRTTSGPLATARRLTTGLVVAAAFGTGVVGTHLASARTAAAGEGVTAAGASEATGDDGLRGTDDGAGTRRVPGFGAVAPIQPGVAAPHARTSGS